MTFWEPYRYKIEGKKTIVVESLRANAVKNVSLPCSAYQKWLMIEFEYLLSGSLWYFEEPGIRVLSNDVFRSAWYDLTDLEGL